MNKPAIRLALTALAAVPLGAWQETLTREGPFWVQSIAGVESGNPSGRLRVSTRGRVTVTGGAEEQIRYTFTKKVKARSEADARRLLGQYLVKTSRQGDLSIINVIHAGDGPATAEMSVVAPRTLRDVSIETFGGSMEATELNGALKAYTGGGRIRLDRIGGQVFARTAGGEIVLGAVGDAVRCISAGGPIRADSIRGEARLETAGGEITLREVEGPVYASTAGGGIEIGRAGATVVVNTAGGAIEVGSARGMVTAETSGGPIHVGAASSVKCETGGGAIRLTNVTGSLRASTAVGNIFATLLAGAVAESFLSTGAGDITVFLPANLAITIHAQNDSAFDTRRIVSEFPGVVVKRQGVLVMAEGDINGGGPVLRLASTGGRIYIKKAQ